MKYFLISALLIFTIPTYAAEINIDSFPSEQSFEVSHTQGKYVDILLEYKGTTLPKVEVIEQFAGFECEVIMVKRTALTTEGTGKYLVLVDWSPGADYSGCHIKITNPMTNLSSDISLYMSYWLLLGGSSPEYNTLHICANKLSVI